MANTQREPILHEFKRLQHTFDFAEDPNFEYGRHLLVAWFARPDSHGSPKLFLPAVLNGQPAPS